MKGETELVYLEQRAIQERRAASKSPNLNARQIHLELAVAYEFRVQLLKEIASRRAGRTTTAEPGLMLRPGENGDGPTVAPSPSQVEKIILRA
jgi:hypothetical protein